MGEIDIAIARQGPIGKSEFESYTFEFHISIVNNGHVQNNLRFVNTVFKPTPLSVQEDNFGNKIVLLDGFILHYKYCKSVQIFQLSC